MIAIGIRSVTAAPASGGSLPSPAAMRVFALELDSALSLLRVKQPAAAQGMPHAAHGQDDAGAVAPRQTDHILAGLVPWARQRPDGRRTKQGNHRERGKQPRHEAYHD